MRLIRWFFISLIKVGTLIICRIDRAALRQVPEKGPLILVSNHVGSLEVPLLFAHLMPRPLTGFAKVETWENKFLGWLFDMWEAIPIRRGEPDMNAVRRGLNVLEEGGILAIAPEGTRSWHGRLLRGKPGVVSMALRTGVPILPLVHWGSENFSDNLKHFRRTDFKIRTGKPFLLTTGGAQVNHTVRQEMIDEIMYQLASLLPEEYRGEYANLDRATKKYLDYSA